MVYLNKKIEDQLHNIGKLKSQGGSHMLVQDEKTTEMVSIGKGFNLSESFNDLKDAGLGGLAMHQVFNSGTRNQKVEETSAMVPSPRSHTQSLVDTRTAFIINDSFDLPMPNLKEIANLKTVEF